MNEPLWQDYHKHTSLSNVYTKDSPLTHFDYWDVLKQRYGDKLCIYTTVEHGWAGDYFHTYNLLEEYNKENDTNIQFVFGYEAYWVKDRHTNDNSNCHMILLARNDNGRKALNKILSIANKDGYYYRPRLDLELIMSLHPDDVMLTTACIAYWNKYQDIDDITAQLASKFPHFYLEVQPHHTKTQADLNRHILELSSQLDVPIIAGCDSHVIFESQMKDRDDLLESAHITYEDEVGFFMDFPTYDILFSRFQKQGVLSDEQIKQAIDNTNVLMDFEDIVLDRSLKVPVVKSLKDKTQQERNDEFEKIVWDEWEQQKWDINGAKHDEYIKEINDAINEIEACNMADYFITTYYTMKDGQEKYGGILTPSGRGSAVSMYLNKILQFTKVDKVNSPVEMYPERFLTKERVLESHVPPDIDHNVSDRQPFIKAQRELVGELGTYDLLALGTLKTKAAWKMYARANGVDPQVANNVSYQIGDYEQAKKHADNPDDINIEDFIAPEFKELFDGCKKYLGIYDNRKGHPCFIGTELVMEENGYKEIQNIKTGDKVLSHDGKFHVVKNTMKSQSSNVYQVKIQGSSKITVTGNHPFLTTRRIRTTPYVKRKIEEYKWKTVEELEKGDLIVSPICYEEKLPILDFVDSSNNNFWWCIGRYFGDGWRSHTVRKSGKKIGQKIKNVIICCNKENKETKDIISHLDWCEYRISENNTTNKIYLKCKGLYQWLEQFGDYAKNKHLTSVIFNLPNEQMKYFISGYISADGHFDKHLNNYRFSSISEKLAYGISYCIAKVYHIQCRISQTRPERYEYIEGRKVHCQPTFTGDFHLDDRLQNRSFYKDRYILCPYQHKEKIDGNFDVYNLEVEDSHSYTVKNMAVHNCATICYDGDAESDIGVILCKSEATGNEVLTAVIESGDIDSFGYLKQDYLIVDSISLTYDIYKEVGLEPFTVNQLLEKIDGDKKVWDIYAQGLTQCVNQCEQPASTQKVMRYKPKNISELTQFIAAIRPGFKSMYHTFESRQHFEYGIKALDNLIQDEYRSSSFIIYQEDLMKVLEFAGFPIAETYTIIKAISKKKEYVIKEAKPKFIQGFTQRILDTGETDDRNKAESMANEVWQIVSDNSLYSFNAAHAYCMAIDSVTIAYLKAYYPLEFYKCVLQRYTNKGDKSKVSLIKQEMLRRGYQLKDAKFGDDNRQFNIDRENNYITQTLTSIKGMPKSTPQALYELGQSGIKTRSQLYQALIDNPNINVKAIDILFKLDYFSMFAPPNKLIDEFSIYQKYCNSKALSKSKLTNEEIEAVRPYCGTETEKQFRNLDNNKLIQALIKTSPIRKTSIVDRIKYQLELLEYSTLKDENESVDNWIVVNIDQNNYGTTKVTMYNICHGVMRTYRVNRNFIKTHPLKAGNYIECLFQEKDRMRKMDDGTFKATGEKIIELKAWKYLDKQE